jgi:hypothetical protein
VTVEKILYTFIKGLIDAAAPTSKLLGAQITETVYGAVTKDRCVQIGPCRPRLAPSPGAEALEEFDASLVVVFLSKVGANRDDAAYAAAREDVVAMAQEVGLAVFNNNDLSGAVRDALPESLPRDFTKVGNTEPYAVANLVIGVNVVGDLITPGARE